MKRAWTLKSTPLWRSFWSDRIFKKKKCTSACAVRIEACIHSVLHFKVLLFSYLLSNRVKQTAKFPKYWRNDTFSIGTIHILRQNNVGLFWPTHWHYVSINTVLNVSKTGHFLDPPTKAFADVQVNNMRSFHNLTWYSAIVHKIARFYPVCSTYEQTKQFK